MHSLIDSIHKVSVSLLQTLSSKATYKIIVDEMQKLSKAQYFSIFLEIGGELKRVYSTIPRSIVAKKASSYHYRERSFNENKIYVLEVNEIKEAHPEMDKIKSILLIPLSNRDKVIGVISVLSTKTKKFDKKRLALLRVFGTIASMGIRKAQLYEEIKEAVEARDLFISTAAHELKTPLTTITVYNELIYNTVMGGRMPEKKWVEGLTSQVYRLTKLINEFLQIDTLKISDLRYEWNMFDIKELTNQAVKTFQIKHPKRKIEITDELGKEKGFIRGDFDKLLQVLNNLFDNAVKFSPKNAPIEVRQSKKAPYYSIQVIDHGRGITKKDLPNIFKKYYKGDVHGKPGMGIGLFLSRKIIERHHGIINITSKQKAGTTVEVLLPYGRAAS